MHEGHGSRFSAALSGKDVKILMEAQYRFPISIDPYRNMASRLGLSVEDVLSRLRKYRDAGLLKRIGFHVNYRSRRLVAALIGYRVEGDAGTLRRAVANDPAVSHAYLRSHQTYNMWIVVKEPNLAKIKQHASLIADKIKAEEYVVLPSVRTFKLSVKYDLLRGVSWSTVTLRNPRAPSLEKAGVNPMVLSRVRSIPIEERPFRLIASSLGLEEGELVELARKLIAEEILVDPGAALSGEKLGFKHNAMIAVSCVDCCRQAAGIPYTTHVALRRVVLGEWRHPCFMMIHARSRRLSSLIVSKISDALGNPDMLVLYSVKDLKPGVIR